MIITTMPNLSYVPPLGSASSGSPPLMPRLR